MSEVMEDVDEEDFLGIRDAQKLLPAWFVPRMMTDSWSFALVTTQGCAILIETIDAVHQAADGSLWFDVQLLEDDEFWVERLRSKGFAVITAPTSRASASIAVAHIIAAFEIADT